MARRRPKAKSGDVTEALQRIELSPVSQFCSTGCTILDLAIADKLPGGFAVGRISHVYGVESSAKTVLAQEPLGAAQRAGGEAWLVDAEQTFDYERASIFGLDTSERFHYVNTSCIEDLFDEVIIGALKGRNVSSPPGAIAIDSLSALPSKVEIEES